MDALNGIVTALFDLLCRPLAGLGWLGLLALLSALFGVLALFAFKHLSFQRRIKAAKDLIKAHMIEIRIYQDDLRIVGRAILKVLGRNAQYLGLNLVPLVPLALPFTLVAVQLVTRFAFEPAPVHARGTALLAGQGTTLEVELAEAQRERVSELEVRYPAGLEPVSPLVRLPGRGRAFQEFVARVPGCYAIELQLGGQTQTKEFCAGQRAPLMQPERGRGFLEQLLWPAEPGLSASSPIERVAFRYPERELPWLPSGPEGVLLFFLVVSMLAGLAALKPLRVQI
jgi:hypothetical protein